MGNFHCIPSSCAEVVYQEYLPPVVRWRYPGEQWQEIEGDDYATKFKDWYGGQDPSKGYTLIWGAAYFSSPYVFAGWAQSTSGAPQFTTYPIVDVRIFSADVNTTLYEYWSYNGQSPYTLPPNVPKSGPYTIQAKGKDGVWRTWLSSRARGLKIYGFTNDAETPIADCILTISKNGETVYQETRSVCPEVEKLPCRLSDEFKERKIDKFPYTERIEVRNQSINPVFVGPTDLPFIDTKSLPIECLNIYNTYTLAPPILSEYVPLPGVINPYNFIQQICSAPGCPPPEYTVICDCDCEECPSGTCAVNCDGHICCYDTETGISIKSIAEQDYCGGTP